MVRTRVTCDGAERALVSASVAAEIASEASQATTGGGGLIVSEADLVWARHSGMALGARHPWRTGDVPDSGCRIAVETDFPTGVHRWFTGRVDASRADLGSDTVRSHAVSEAARLSREVTVPSVAYVMPTREPGATAARVGMCASWATQHVAAQCGFTSVAPIQPEVAVAASMIGSTYPAVGRVSVSRSTTRPGNASPYARQVWWGGGTVVDPHVIWHGSRPSDVPAGSPMTLVIDLGEPRPTDSYDVLVRLSNNPGEGAGFGIRVTQNQYQLLRITATGAITPGPTQPRRRHATRVQATHAGTVTTLRDDIDAVSIWTGGTTLSHGWATVEILQGRGDVGGVQLFHADRDLTTAPRTLVLRRDLYGPSQTGATSVIPWYQGDAAAYLVDQSRSERIPIWVDGHGVMHVTDQTFLDVQRPTGVVADAMLPDLLTSAGNLFPDPWPSGAGWTGLGAVTYPQTPLGPIARIAFPAAGSTSSWSQGLRTTIPVQSGSEVTVSCQVRLVSLADTDATGTVTMSLRGWSRTSTGSLINTADPHQITLAPSQEWSHATITVPTPLDAAQVQVELSNFFPAGGMAAVLEVRHFTTLSPVAVLEELSASLSAGPGYGRVVVTGEEWIPRTSTLPRILIGSGQRQTMAVGESETIMWHPDADTLWLDGSIDTSPARWTSTTTDAHRRIGSVVGGHRFNQNNFAAGLTATHFPASMELVDGRTVRYTGTVATLPDGWTMSTLPNPADWDVTPSIPESRKGDPLPECRSRGIARREARRTIIDLPGDGPDYTLDGGHWLSSEAARLTVGQQIASRITDPQPIIDGMQCALAPVAEGDRITLRVTTVADLTLDVVVQEIRPVLDQGYMTLQARVLGWVGGTTYRQWLDSVDRQGAQSYAALGDLYPSYTAIRDEVLA